MTTPTEEALEERNQALFSLRRLDNKLRRALASEKGKEEVDALLAEREELAQVIRDMNAEPWDFSTEGDNSWLVRRRRN